VNSGAASVEEYLREVRENWRPALTELRQRCREILTGYDEAIQYGIPTYSRNGTPEVAFASQKNYISLYITRNNVLNRHRDELPRAGKGCIRYSSPAKLDFDVIEQMLHETVMDPGLPCE
jgi:uncharacterized protein YdhG (YjbR/CyaY superfamily)